MPCPGPLHFSHIADYVYSYYDFFPLPVSEFGPACCVEHTSFHFGLCGRRKYVLCWFSLSVKNVKKTMLSTCCPGVALSAGMRK